MQTHVDLEPYKEQKNTLQCPSQPLRPVGKHTSSITIWSFRLSSHTHSRISSTSRNNSGTNSIISLFPLKACWNNLPHHHHGPSEQLKRDFFHSGQQRLSQFLCFSWAGRLDAASFSHNPVFQRNTVIVIKFNLNGVKTESQSAVSCVSWKIVSVSLPQTD